MKNFTSQFETLDHQLNDFYKFHRMDEHELLKFLSKHVPVSQKEIDSIHKKAQKHINSMRKLKAKPMGIETLLLQYKLNTEQGIALMCLAEAMLRVPDRGTINELIEDKLGDGDWANAPMMQ